MSHYYIGDPDQQTSHWQVQNKDDNCAVAAQTCIIDQFLPGELTLDQANYITESNGWYVPGYGTSIDNVGNLLELYGISVHRVDHADISQLAQELQEGHRVIVGINADQLWDEGPLHDFYEWLIHVFGLDTADFQPANHAVAVTGIDISDPSHPMVILNDTGDPHGAAATYPLDKFMDAWQNSDFHYVATNSAPGAAAPWQIDLSHLIHDAQQAMAHPAGDPHLAVQAGQMADELSHNVDWDKVLKSI